MSGGSGPDPPLAVRVTSAARSNFLLQPLAAVLAAVSQVVVARVLSVEAFALYATALALRSTVQFLADFGTGSAASRTYAELRRRGDRHGARRLFGRLLSLRVVVVGTLTLVAILFPDATANVLGLRENEHYFVYFVAALGACETIGALAYYLLTGALLQAQINRVVVAQNLGQPVAVLLAASIGGGTEPILAALVLVSFLKAATLSWLAVRELSSLRSGDGTVKEDPIRYGRVAGASLLAKTAAWVNTRQIVSIVALGSRQRTELAAYSLGYDLSHQVLSAVTGPVTGLVLPSMASSDPERGTRLQIFRVAIRVLGLLAFAAGAVLIAAGVFAVPLLYGSRYADAVPFLVVVTALLAVETAVNVPATALMLVTDRLLGAYALVRAITLALGVVGILLASTNLIAAAAFMMSTRAATAMALFVIVRRDAGEDTAGRWLAMWGVIATVASGSGVAAGELLHGGAGAALTGAAVAVLVLAAGARVFRVVGQEEAALAARLHPLAGRLARAFRAAPEEAYDASSPAR